MILERKETELFYSLWFPLLDAVLLPFRGRIITDGLVVSRNIVFGRGAATDFKDAYMEAKKNNRILFSF